MTQIDDERRTRDSTEAGDSGTATQDFRSRFAPPEAPRRTALTAAEQRLRTRGAWMVVTGCTTVALTVALAIVWRVGFGTDMPLTFVLPIYAAGFGSIGLGGMEYLSRHARHKHAEILARMDRLERTVTMLVELIPVEMQQQFHQGQAAAFREYFGTRTGTDDDQSPGTADVLKMHRRNSRAQG